MGVEADPMAVNNLISAEAAHNNPDTVFKIVTMKICQMSLKDLIQLRSPSVVTN